MSSGAKKSAATAWRPSWKEVLGSPVHFLAFGGGAGLFPKGPGTAGTLVAIPIWFLLSQLSLPAYLVAVMLAFLLGCWICGASARMLGVHDYGGIVFDEIVGFLITCLPMLAVMGFGEGHKTFGVVVAFVAFRVFDIWKPWPIGGLDRRLHGGLGIMIDDVVAGIYAALAVAFTLCLANDAAHW